MKSEIWVFVVGLVLAFGFGIVMMQGNFMTGYVVLDGEEVSEMNESFTREDAMQVLNESQEIIDEMKVAGFSGVLVGDLLIEAEKVFQQVEYAEILRGNINASVNEARDALRLVDWRTINYSDVLEYTEEIEGVRELAFFVQDLLSLQESFLGAERNEAGEIVVFTKVEDVDLDRFKFLINEVQIAIDDARYGEAQVLAEELKEEVDLRRTEVFTALTLARGFRNILVKYWYFTLLVFVILISGGYYSSKIIRKRLLRRKIRRMKIEEKVLLALMKKTQEERFKEDNISGLVYNIRMKKFEEKMNLIKEDLPVLEKRLAGVKKEKLTKEEKAGEKKKSKVRKGKPEKKEGSTIARRLVSRWEGK